MLLPTVVTTGHAVALAGEVERLVPRHFIAALLVHLALVHILNHGMVFTGLVEMHRGGALVDTHLDTTDNVQHVAKAHEVDHSNRVELETTGHQIVDRLNGELDTP